MHFFTDVQMDFKPPLPPGDIPLPSDDDPPEGPIPPLPEAEFKPPLPVDGLPERKSTDS